MKFPAVSGVAFLCFLFFWATTSVYPKSHAHDKRVFNSRESRSSFSRETSSYCSTEFPETVEVVKTPTDGGIEEIIPDKYTERYQRWKAEFLSTDLGRQQWNRYAENKNFILTITVSEDKAQGAGTDAYKWNDEGDLVAATIHLGSKLDKGFPNPIYFPVMNSLSLIDFPRELNNDALAAAKIAHEFGHINLTYRMKSDVVRLQNKLIPDYNKILLSNGYNTQDTRLLDLVGKMGGTPVEIWENREYWSEANAMNYIVEKINRQNFYCRILSRIESNVKFYATGYEDRFQQVAKSNPADSCHW